MQGTPSSTPLFSHIQTQLAPYAQQAKKMLNPVLPYIRAYVGYALRWQLPISAAVVLGRAIKHCCYDPKGLTEYSWKKAGSELFKGTICPLGPVWIFQQSMNKPGFGPFVQAFDEAVKSGSKDDSTVQWLAFGKAYSEASPADRIAVREYIQSQNTETLGYILNRMTPACRILLFPDNNTYKASLEDSVQAYDWLMAADAAIYKAGKTETASPEQRLAAQAASDRLENLAFNYFSRADLEKHQFGAEYPNIRLAQEIVNANIKSINDSIAVFENSLSDEDCKEIIAKTPFIKEQYGFKAKDIEQLYDYGAYPANKKDHAGNTMAHILATHKNYHQETKRELFEAELNYEQLRATNHAGDSVVRILAANGHPAFLKLFKGNYPAGEHASNRQPTLLAVAISGATSLDDAENLIALTTRLKSEKDKAKYIKDSQPHILAELDNRLKILALEERTNNLHAPRTDIEMKMAKQASELVTKLNEIAGAGAPLTKYPFLMGAISEYQFTTLIEADNLEQALPFAQNADKAMSNKFGLPEKLKSVDQLSDVISLYNAKMSLNNAIQINSSRIINDAGKNQEPQWDYSNNNINNIADSDFIIVSRDMKEEPPHKPAVAEWDNVLKQISSLNPHQKAQLAKAVRETDWKYIPVAVVLELAPKEIHRLARQRQLNGGSYEIIHFFNQKLQPKSNNDGNALPIPENIQIDVARQAEHALKAVKINMSALRNYGLEENLRAAWELLTESRSRKIPYKLTMERPVPPDLHDFQSNAEQAVDDINNGFWQHNAEFKKQFVQLFGEATKWTPGLEEIAAAWEARNPKFPLVNASRIAYKLSNYHSSSSPDKDWDNIIRLIKASPAVAAEVPYQYMNQFSSQQLRELVELGLWSDVKCYDREGMNILHHLADGWDWDEHCTAILQAIHKKQGQHPDAFLISKSENGEKPLHVAAKNYLELKKDKDAALDVMLPLTTLTFDEANSILYLTGLHSQYTDKLIERLKGIINAVKDWDSKQKFIKDNANRFLDTINEKLENGLNSSERQAMAVIAHRAISLFRDVTGLTLPLSNVNELEKIWNIWEQSCKDVVDAGNWAQLPTVLSRLTTKERAAAIKEILIPDSLEVMDQHILVELLQMGVFLGDKGCNAHILDLVLKSPDPMDRVIAFFAQDRFKALWTPEAIQALAERGNVQNQLIPALRLFQPAKKQVEILNRIELTDKIGDLDAEDLELLLDHVAAKRNQKGQNLVHVLVERGVLALPKWTKVFDGLVEEKHQELWAAKNLVGEGQDASSARTPFDLMIESKMNDLAKMVYARLNEQSKALVRTAMTKENQHGLDEIIGNS